jgi:hypothetical protein
MRLLVDFLLRFGWGLAVGLVLTPAAAVLAGGGSPAAAVPPGFFRVNLLVIMGLATFAALVGHAAPTAAWPLAAGAAVTAWAGGVAWFGERRRAGAGLCLATALLLAGGIVVFHAAAADSTVVAAVGGAAAAILSGLVSGLAVHAMLLGHWYLNAPGMRVGLLRRAIDAALVVWGVQLAATVGIWTGGSMTAEATRAAVSIPAGGTVAALVALRWLAGLVGLPILLVMARKTLDIPNTQSATGILYVACLAAILGELTAQLLQAPV